MQTTLHIVRSINSSPAVTVRSQFPDQDLCITTEIELQRHIQLLTYGVSPLSKPVTLCSAHIFELHSLQRNKSCKSSASILVFQMQLRPE